MSTVARIASGIRHRSRVGLVLALVVQLALAVQVAATPSQAEKTAQGILVKMADGQAELAVTSTGALRLSVSYAGTPHAHSSIFLDETPAAAPATWEAVEQADLVGVKTAAGQLLFKLATNQWTVLNAQGQTIIPFQSIGQQTALASQPMAVLKVGWDPQREFFAYGGGNYEPALGHKLGNSRLGNGKVLIPYYWCAAGYALLGIAENDCHPAQWFDRSGDGTIEWSFPGQSGDLYIMPAANLYEALDSFTRLVGRPQVPPKWALGYQQSRWGWEDRAYLEEVLRNFLDRRLPVDAFIYDFEWYTPTPDYLLPPEGDPNFADFGWNPKLFPDPIAQLKQYRQQGIRTVVIRKPRLGNAGQLTKARQQHWLLDHSEAAFFDRALDFTLPAVRAWYGQQHQALIESGIDGWWNDEGEVSYPTYAYWNLAQVAAQAQYRPNQRYWSLNRAFTPGLARTGAGAWTGDVRASWAELLATPTQLLNWSLGGMPYGACDIGGFGGEPSPEMLVRWMQVGTFLPIMRSHSSNLETPRFPWLYPGAEAPIRQALELRYRLIPMIYSLAHEGHATGAPIMRPLLMEFPDDAKLANCSSQWLLGTGLMVAPILAEGGQRTVYLPAGQWYEFERRATRAGPCEIEVTARLDEIPVYVRAGTILPLGPVVQHTSEMPGGPLELQVYSGQDAAFTLVEDDGETYDYLKGAIRQTLFTWDDQRRTLSWKIRGDYAGPRVFQAVKVTVFQADGKVQAELTPLDPAGQLVIARP